MERGQRTIMEAIQIWDTSYANVRKEIKSVVDRRLQQSVDSLWGIEALPFLKQYLLYPYAPEDLAEELLKELANQSEAGGDTAGFVSTQEHFPCQPKPAGRERTPPAFPEGPQYNPPEVYQPAGDTGGKCGGHSKRAGTAIRLLGRGGTAQEPSCSFGRGSRYRGRSGKCTLIHTQRHGRDFMRSSFIWARRAVGVPDC